MMTWYYSKQPSYGVSTGAHQWVKDNVVYIHRGILLSYNIECNFVSYRQKEMGGETGGHGFSYNKADSIKCEPFSFIGRC